MSEKPFGSGYFGEWIDDEFDQPAYRYTCDQVNDSKAETVGNPVWRNLTDQCHQVGNDRLVGEASNYGYVRVRQDEGGAKFLNDYIPAEHQYSGGFGYLTDGENDLSTFYTGNGYEFERIFGTGYIRKMVKSDKYSIDQKVFAPFGDDPLLISQVTIKNNTKVETSLKWIEYWGCRLNQFSFRSLIQAMFRKDLNKMSGIRRKFAKKYIDSFSLFGRQGLINKKHFKGRNIVEKITWKILELVYASIKTGTMGGKFRYSLPEVSFEDENPPEIFLVSLDAPVSSIKTDGNTFFGKGGAGSPDGIHGAPEYSINAGDAMILEREFALNPGEAQTLYFAYGYIPEDFEIESLIEKYLVDLPGLFKRTVETWKEDNIVLDIPDEPWIARETKWSNYYLRSNMTYDSFFKEHRQVQSSPYLYMMGMHLGPEDQVLYSLPFTLNVPWIVKENIRYILKEMLPDGRIASVVTGNGMIVPTLMVKTLEHPLNLLWLVSEYILSTRDFQFLEEEVTTYPYEGEIRKPEKIKDLLQKAYNFVTGFNIGKHGLLRILRGDWNDILLEFIPAKYHKAIEEQGESVLSSATAAFTFNLYAQLLEAMGEMNKAQHARKEADKQIEAVRAVWNGNWFRRAWFSDKLGWFGDKELWLEPQPWAILGNCTTEAQSKILVSNIDKLLRVPSPIGPGLASDTEFKDPGELTNGGVFLNMAGMLCWALAGIDGEMAWDEYKKNLLSNHAEVFPELWYGIWSGPDHYSSVLSKYPGHTFFDKSILDKNEEKAFFTNFTDFPVMNPHSHMWSMYSAAKLMGVKFTKEGLMLKPVIPKEIYSFSSPLVGIIKTRTGYSGWYAPLQSGKWKIAISLEEQDRVFERVKINGIEAPVENDRDGNIIIFGEGSKDSPLKWDLL